MPCPDRKRRLLKLAGACLAFALLLLALYRRQTDIATLELVGSALRAPAGTDSTTYMRLGERTFRQAGPRLYEQLFFTEHQKFIYPPSSLFLIEATDALPRLHISPERFWKALMFAGWVGSVLLGVLFFREQSGGQAPPYELAAVAVLGILFLPFAEAFVRGQVQMLLTAVWGLSALLFAKQQKGWAGAAIALTCVFKPQLAIFLLWGLLRREWRFLAGFSVLAAGLGAVSLAHFGVHNHVEYLAVLRTLSRQGEALAANQSVTGALNRLLRNGNALTWSTTAYAPYRPAIYIASTLCSLAFLLLGLFLPRRPAWAGTTADFLFFGCLSVLLSPIAWEHHYGYFFFAFVALLARAQKLPTVAWAALCGALLLISNRLPPLDGLVAGPVSLLGDYLLWSALLTLALLAWHSGTESRPAAAPFFEEATCLPEREPALAGS